MISERREGPAAESGTETAYWDIENSLHEEKLTSPRIFRRFVLPALIILVVVLALLLVRENRKVKELSTGANTHQVHDGVIPHAGNV